MREDMEGNVDERSMDEISKESEGRKGDIISF